MNPKTPAILFDLDGTLLDRDSSLKRFLEEQYSRFASSLAGIDSQAFICKMVELDQFGHVPKPGVYAQLRKHFCLSEKLEQTLLDDFERLFPGLAIPFPGMHELLQQLCEEGWTLGLVTNGTTQSQRPKINALGIADYFGAILISEEQGVRKPDPEIYRRAMVLLSAEPEMTWFVGDHPEADIAGAVRAGLRTIWKRNLCWPAPDKFDAMIDELGEIASVLKMARIRSPSP